MTTEVVLRGGPSGPVLTGSPGNAVVIGADGHSVTSAPFPAGGVTSWNTRVGAVLPVTNDYDISQINGIGSRRTKSRSGTARSSFRSPSPRRRDELEHTRRRRHLPERRRRSLPNHE